MAAPDVELAVSPFRIYNQELRIVGSMAIVDSFGRAVEVVAEHDEALRRLVTHHLSLDAFDEALERLRDRDGREGGVERSRREWVSRSRRSGTRVENEGAEESPTSTTSSPPVGRSTRR